MSETRIACDFDGTLARFGDAVIELINYKYGCKLNAYMLRQYEWWEQPEIARLGVTKQTFWEAVDIIHRNNWTDALKTYDKDTLRVLRRLQSKHDVFILTVKPNRHLETVTSWLQKNFIVGIEVAKTKPDGLAAEEKLYYDWELLIDDNPKIAELLLNTKPPGRAMILLDAPWNRYLHVPEGNKQVVRLSGWGEIENLMFPPDTT